MTDFPFLPYGVMPGEFKKKGLDDQIVMVDWRPSLPQDERLKTFNTWKQDRLKEFGAHIWPQYDFKTRKFVGSARNFAKDLTFFEVGAMIDAFMPPNNILETKPTSPLAVTDIKMHLYHYEIEDQNPNPPGASYRLYDRTLTIQEEETLVAVMIDAISNGDTIGKKAAGHFFFKDQMQRPRPLHAAMLAKREASFVSELSERGQHPSIVSGHCFQGVMMACAVLEHWIATNPNLSQERIASLAQYMVDVGDRRVFAGVHYPSDNIASWSLAMALIPEVFDDHETIVRFLRYAVMEKSTVFQLIRDTFLDQSNLAFTEPSIKLLQRYDLDPSATVPTSMA
ncbi:MAG: phosphatase PAP2 family protein [Pseudomonadota bacterium]